MPTDKHQFAIVSENGTIEAVILTRGDEFYCFERVEDALKSLKEAMALYPGGKLVELTLVEKKT
jgi:hypothetical protein